MSEKDVNLIPVKPGAYCEDRHGECHFLSWTGNDQENYCGLYGKFTNNTYDFKKKMKPSFCKALVVKVEERESGNAT